MKFNMTNLPPKLQITHLRQTGETLRELIGRTSGQRVFISSTSKRLRNFRDDMKFSPTKSSLKPFYDGLILNPNHTNFQFRLYQGNNPTIELEYEYVQGILIPLRREKRLVELQYFMC
jgi:hypothetical protein